MKMYIFICIFFCTGCTNAYHTHFFREHPEFQSGTIISSEESFHSTGYIDVLPNKITHTELIHTINQAKKRIWIEIYTWTDAAKLTEPIIAAHQRWIDVRVALEWNVFGTPKINASIFWKLTEAGIPVVYTDNYRYAFTHAKFWIIDDAYSISTGNWTASFFDKNREYIYHDSDTATLDFLSEIFLADFSHLWYKGTTTIPDHIVISPLNARTKIESLLLSTKNNLLIYIQTLDDDHIISILRTLQSQHKKIIICTADNESNTRRMLESPELPWKSIRKPYLHAKIIIVDHAQVFIGSHNLTTNAIENNREMGIILTNTKKIITQIENNFIQDKCQ